MPSLLTIGRFSRHPVIGASISMNLMMKPTLFRKTLVTLSLGLSTSFSCFAAEKAPVETHLPIQEFTRETMFGLLVGEMAATMGNLPLASSAYSEMATKTRDPRVAQRAFELSMAAQKLPLAAESVRLWAQLDPNSSSAQEMNVALLLATDKADEAVTVFNKHVKAHPERTAPLFLQLNNWFDYLPSKTSSRLALAERFAQSFKTLPEANYAIAAAALNDGKATPGLAAIEAALKTRPAWPEASLIKAGLLQIESAAKAMDWLASWQKKHGEHAVTNAYLARLYLSENKVAEAKAAYAQQIKIAPRDANAPYVSGLIAREQNNHAAAISYFEMALERGHQDRDSVRFYLADSQVEQKQISAALENFDAVSGDKWAVRALTRSSILRAKNGQAEQAFKRIHAVRKIKDSPDLWRIEGEVLRETGKLPEAYATLSEGLKNFTDNDDLLYGRSMIADQLGKYAEAESDLKIVLAKNPEDPSALNALGYMLADRTERLDEAAVLIEKAHKLKPEDPFILDSLGWLYVRQGKLAEGLERLQKAYAAQPDPEIAAHLVENLWRLGRKDEAQKLWASANQLNPSHAALAKVQRTVLTAP